MLKTLCKRHKIQPTSKQTTAQPTYALRPKNINVFLLPIKPFKVSCFEITPKISSARQNNSQHSITVETRQKMRNLIELQ